MDVARLLITLGFIVMVVGLLWPVIDKLGLGHLPGDIIIRRENVSFYFPIVTCLLVSIAISLLFWLLTR
jgi:hypothetical protein